MQSIISSRSIQRQRQSSVSLQCRLVVHIALEDDDEECELVSVLVAQHKRDITRLDTVELLVSLEPGLPGPELTAVCVWESLSTICSAI